MTTLCRTEFSLTGVEPESATVTNAMIEEFNRRHATDVEPSITGIPLRRK